MYIRKLAAAAGFATGAALALAPLAAAAPTDLIDPTTVLASEDSSLNSLFSFDALLAGDYNDIIAPTATQPFDTIPLADAPNSGTVPTELGELLYGVNSISQAGSDPGAYDVFNGALTQFDNAYNVELYSLFNGGTFDNTLGDYIYNGTIQSVVTTPGETTTQAFDTLYNAGIADLSGYFNTDLSSLDLTAPTADAGAAAASTTDLSTTVSSEISSLNSLFSTEATAYGVGGDLVAPATGQPFETITTAGAPDVAPFNSFDSFLYGLNPADNVSSDPGAYDLFNGALAKFDDALNFGVYALENGGAALPSADFATDLFGISGTAATTLAGETATQAVSTLFSDGLADLSGYFDFSALGSLF